MIDIPLALFNFKPLFADPGSECIFHKKEDGIQWTSYPGNIGY
jgi:hypothetical protein